MLEAASHIFSAVIDIVCLFKLPVEDKTELQKCFLL